jgi:endonuclease YncB( thermonuclease family)
MQSRAVRFWLPVASRAFAVLLATLPLACTSAAETISGRAKVIDGDSIEIGSTSIRLHAIDAFEGRQVCYRGTSTWTCGAAAASELRRLVGTRQITCAKKDTDSYGRTVAICSNGDSDLGAEMVRAGLALAYRQYGNDYVDEEKDARTARRGAWSGEFTAPWDERHGTASKPLGGERSTSPSAPATSAASAAPATSAASAASTASTASPSAGNGCRGTGIKGNINREGEHIYHVPGSRSYADTIIDEGKGERWFCTEDEARRAGWRAPGG